MDTDTLALIIVQIAAIPVGAQIAAACAERRVRKLSEELGLAK